MKSGDIDGNDLYGMSKEYFDDHIAINKVHDGSLDLPKGVNSMGNLETIKGNLITWKTSLTSLGKLKEIEGSYSTGVDSLQTNITTLGNLERVGGHISLAYSKLTSLGNLKHVGRNLYMENTELTSLGKLESVGGRIFCTLGGRVYDLLMNSKFKDQVNH